jgi:2-keto-4-pentenoate hydratase/2-oxohepta-3-ene-1,7-dioic acid hydratase in catechol pathway
MKLVSFATNDDATMSSGIKRTAGISETLAVAELAGLAGDSRMHLDSTRAILGRDPAQLLVLQTLPNRTHRNWHTETPYIQQTRRGSNRPLPIHRICLGVNYRDHAERGRSSPFPRTHRWSLQIPEPID